MSRNLKNPVRKYLFELLTLKFRAIKKKKDKLVLKLKNDRTRTTEKQLTAYQYL